MGTKNNRKAMIIAVSVATAVCLLCIGILFVTGLFVWLNREKTVQIPEQESTKIPPAINLEGIWQNNGFMAAGWADRYHFYPSGTFRFYPNQMICKEVRVEKIGSWNLEGTQLTLTTTRQVVINYEVSESGNCSILEKKEVTLEQPGNEQFTVADRGTQEGDIYPSISIGGQTFWKFSDDASHYWEEEYPE